MHHGSQINSGDLMDEFSRMRLDNKLLSGFGGK